GPPPGAPVEPQLTLSYLLSNVKATGRLELPASLKPLVPARPLPLARGRAAPGSSGGARAALPGVCPWARPRHPTPEPEAAALFDWVPCDLRRALRARGGGVTLGRGGGPLGNRILHAARDDTNPPRQRPDRPSAAGSCQTRPRPVEFPDPAL